MSFCSLIKAKYPEIRMLCFVLKYSVLLNILCIEYRLRVLPYAILSKPLHQAHFLVRQTNASHALTCALTRLSKSSTQPPTPPSAPPTPSRMKVKNSTRGPEEVLRLSKYQSGGYYQLSVLWNHSDNYT